MRYGIFSDVHGNLEALSAVITALEDESIHGYLCGGDIVGYGANPQECIKRVQDLECITVAGNHDWAVIGKVDTSYFNPVAKEAIIWTQHCLPEEGKAYLEQLPLEHRNNDLILVHSTLQNPGQFNYLSDVRTASEMFDLMDRNVCFVGHTHVPLIIWQQGGGLKYTHDNRVEVDQRNRYIVNVGSVGQPRDGNPLAAYCVYDTDLKTIEIKRVAYSLEEAQRKILDAGLPEMLAIRLGIGQ